MNYEVVYKNLILKGKNRILDGYRETHHVIPKCLGGSDEDENLVELTAREHFIAHQLLHKIYPHHKGLIFAVFSMNNFGKVKYSRNYEWIKKRLSESRTIHFDKEKLQEDILTMNKNEVAKKYNVHYNTIYKRVKEYNLEHPPEIVDKSNLGRNSVDIDINWLQNELMTKSIIEISKDNNYNVELVRRRVKDNNLGDPNHYRRINKPSLKQKEPDIDLVWLQEELTTKSMPQISKENDFDYEWLRYRVNKYKLSTPIKRTTLESLNLKEVAESILKYGISETARIMNCSSDTIKAYIEKHQLDYDKKYRKRKNNEVI